MSCPSKTYICAIVVNFTHFSDKIYKNNLVREGDTHEKEHKIDLYNRYN